MTLLDKKSLLAPVIEIAREAGQKILLYYDQKLSVEHKYDKTPLTEADMAAHHVIVDGLKQLTPNIPVLSEESLHVSFAERSGWDTYWLVDPLDGTREFIKGNGEFTVNIALIENNNSVLGVIHVPVTGVDYYACTGQGAYKSDKNVFGEEATGDGSQGQDFQGKNLQGHKIQVRKWNGGRVTVAGSRSHRSKEFEDFLSNIGEHEVISIGSSLKSCLVAEGRADIYVRLGLTSEWDTAAAQCIVEQAGGQLTDTRLQTLRYNTKESLLNPHFLVFGDARHDWTKYLPSGC